jgi:tetratricopeptide (TPR) repeat protein
MLYFASKFVWSAATASVALVVLCTAVAAERPTASLDRGFHLLYNLDFDGAQEHFAAYQQQHEDDPMGPVAEAAGLLFSELNRLEVLGPRFFDRDSASRSRPTPQADSAIRNRFDSALQRAESLARPRLASDPNDRNALLAITLVNGLKADYSALLENRYRIALRYTRSATAYARQLLAICPDCYDAYIATGISRYLIGSLSAPLRWILRIGGFSGDKRQGMAELQLVAERGHYLAPYARILLAIAYIREKNFTASRQLLIQLRDEFPRNPLFTQELARLDTGR